MLDIPPNPSWRMIASPLCIEVLDQTIPSVVGNSSVRRKESIDSESSSDVHHLRDHAVQQFAVSSDTKQDVHSSDSSVSTTASLSSESSSQDISEHQPAQTNTVNTRDVHDNEYDDVGTDLSSCSLHSDSSSSCALPVVEDENGRVSAPTATASSFSIPYDTPSDSIILLCPIVQLISEGGSISYRGPNPDEVSTLLCEVLSLNSTRLQRYLVSQEAELQKAVERGFSTLLLSSDAKTHSNSTVSSPALPLVQMDIESFSLERGVDESVSGELLRLLLCIGGPADQVRPLDSLSNVLSQFISQYPMEVRARARHMFLSQVETICVRFVVGSLFFFTLPLFSLSFERIGIFFVVQCFYRLFCCNFLSNFNIFPFLHFLFKFFEKVFVTTTMWSSFLGIAL